MIYVRTNQTLSLHQTPALQAGDVHVAKTGQGGTWSAEEQMYHINYLELKAALFALQCFRAAIVGKHVRLLLDNSTAVACINHMGTSHSVNCNQITYTIWDWCIKHDVWVSAAHIPGKLNTAADTESRRVNLDAEWQLNKEMLKAALTVLHYKPELDFFASRLNSQLSLISQTRWQSL